MPRRERAWGGIAVMSDPANTIVPVLGATSPLIRLNRVVFPAPFGPIRRAPRRHRRPDYGVDGPERAIRLRDLVELKKGCHKKLLNTAAARSARRSFEQPQGDSRNT